MAVDLKNPERYIDLRKHFETIDDQGKGIGSTYVDFEGLASGKDLDKWADDAIADRGLGFFEEDKEMAELIKNLLIHLMYNDREADEEPDHNRNLTRVDTMLHVLSARFWLKWDAK